MLQPPCRRPVCTTCVLQVVDATGNAGSWRTAFAFNYDPLPPTGPLTVIEASGVVSGTWQATVPDARFSWTGAADTLSGVAGYYVYWGASPIGASGYYSTTAAFDPPALATASATYYLRLRTRDAAGNLTPWRTVFVFRYGTPSASPTLPVDPDSSEFPDEESTEDVITEPPTQPPAAPTPLAPINSSWHRTYLPLVTH